MYIIEIIMCILVMYRLSDSSKTLYIRYTFVYSCYYTTYILYRYFSWCFNYDELCIYPKQLNVYHPYVVLANDLNH